MDLQCVFISQSLCEDGCLAPFCVCAAVPTLSVMLGVATRSAIILDGLQLRVIDIESLCLAPTNAACDIIRSVVTRLQTCCTFNFENKTLVYSVQMFVMHSGLLPSPIRESRP